MSYGHVTLLSQYINYKTLGLLIIIGRQNKKLKEGHSLYRKLDMICCKASLADTASLTKTIIMSTVTVRR